MNGSEIPGGDQPPRVKVTSPSVPPESDMVIGEVPETTWVLASAAMAEEATASSTMVGDDGNGSGRVIGDGQAMEGSGAMELRGKDEATGQLEGVGGSEKRATEAHGGGSLEGTTKEADASPVRQPRADLGKDPIVEEEPVEERETPAMLVGNGEGAGSSQHIGMGDYLEAASLEDLVETLPERLTYDESLVLREHLSLRRDEERLPEAVKEMVREAGFGEFIGVLTRASNDHQVVRALSERWWDTTNSFHFSFSEMTMTPLDFSMIIGLRVGGDPFLTTPRRGGALIFKLRQMLGHVLRAEKEDAQYTQILGF
ncbi:hypothetical protein RHMOL_Rhmol08G0163500 [Rhododendron molle]|uniref:Uncharacterized protein n=1 Tax=Rhododendron molle TaxID=49168 RepID=A0ACC0MQG3_RHOML|nr:hypothetical protein RHMOL_Rhmol08G0163500 [Rhododendron molle]